MASSIPPRESRRLRAVQAHMANASKEDIKSLALRLAEEADELEEKALLDGLTRLWNRSAILDLCARELAKGMVNKTSTGVLLLDIDHFKRVNDRHGHQSGDEVLRQVASRVLEGVRPTDAVGRYGGEEFLVVLPHCSVDDVFSVGERVRIEINKHPIATTYAEVRVSVSVGCTVSVDGGHFTDILVRAADQAMYRAKREGRNRTIVRQVTPSSLGIKIPPR